MAIADDFTVAVNGDIRHSSGTSTYTVLELHRWLQDIADDAEPATANDFVDITSETPSDRSTDNIITLINGYNIDDDAAEYFYDGSIEQLGGSVRYAGLVVVGSAPAGTQLQIVQDGALLTSYWGTGLNDDAANNILLRILIKTRVDGHDLDGGRILVQARELGASGADTYGEFSVTMGLGNNTAAIFTSDDLNAETAAATIATYDQFSNTEGYQLLNITGSGSHPFYSQWAIGGGTTPASPTINDLYEYTKWTQRRGTSTNLHGINGELFRGITHDITYDTLTGTLTENNLLVWGTEFAYDTELASGLTVGKYYEFSDDGYTTIKAVAKLLALDDNGAAGYVVMAKEPGGVIADNDTFRAADGTATNGATVDGATKLVDGNAVGGRGLVLADEGSTNVYIQLLDGVAPVNNLPIHDATTAGVYDEANNDALVNVTVTSRTVSPEFLGTSTGTALIGAYGIGMDPTDTSATDQFFDLNNVLRQPPNNVTYDILGLVNTQGYILVGPEDGSGGLDTAQLTLNTNLTGAAETSVVVAETIPSDTPDSGTLRVTTDGGVEQLCSYTSFTGSTFTISAEDFSGDNATGAKGVYITYLDKVPAGATESFTYVYNGDRVHFIRYRDGAIATTVKTFETTGTMGSGGGATTVIFTTDL